MKTAEQRRARELRAEGCSIKEIERRLGVARSSVSRWVQDVQLSDDQRRVLASRVTEGGSYATGCMLYWAEGD